MPKIMISFNQIFSAVAKMCVHKTAEIEKEEIEPICATLCQGEFNIR